MPAEKSLLFFHAEWLYMEQEMVSSISQPCPDIFLGNLFKCDPYQHISYETKAWSRWSHCKIEQGREQGTPWKI